ncbi:MAG: LLM class flavin-dependent oxidoreductase [Actinomycetota bacterium]
MERIGLTVGLEGSPLPDALDLCRRAETLGYTDIWSAEVGGADGFSPLAALAATTSSARLGTAIVPVFTRPPALVAMQAATLQSISGGRFALGLGTSSDIIINRWMGAGFETPLTRLEEYIEVVRSSLEGQKVDFEGKSTSLSGFRLQLDPGGPVPIYAAALGPRACRLAGRVADGVIFFLKTPDGVKQALGWVAEGASEAGRDPGQLDCVIRLPVAMDEDEEVLGLMARRLITSYVTVDVYNRSISTQGFKTEARDIKDAWRTGDRERANDLVSDELVDRLLIFGDRDACREKLRAFRDAGVKTPVLFPFSVAGDPVERKKRVGALVETLAPA